MKPTTMPALLLFPLLLACGGGTDPSAEEMNGSGVDPGPPVEPLEGLPDEGREELERPAGEGTLNNGLGEPANTSEEITPGTFEIAQLVGSKSRVCALEARTRQVWCWDDNLGSEGMPQRVNFDFEVARIFAGGQDALCGVGERAGRVHCYSVAGLAVRGITELDHAPEQLWVTQQRVCTLLRDQGVFRCWGDQVQDVAVNAVDQAAISTEVACILSGGIVMCSGDNARGGLGVSVEEVAQGEHTVAIPSPAMGLSRGVDISDGTNTYETFCALSDGSLWCWPNVGFADNGAPLIVAEPKRILPHNNLTAFSRGCALADDGALSCGYPDPPLTIDAPVIKGPEALVARGTRAGCAQDISDQWFCWERGHPAFFHSQVVLMPASRLGP